MEKKVEIIVNGVTIHLVLNKNVTDWRNLYRGNNGLRGFALEEILDGTIEPNENIWYWYINGRCYETDEDVCADKPATYHCDVCGEEFDTEDIIWLSASFGVCKDCYNKMPEDIRKKAKEEDYDEVNAWLEKHWGECSKVNKIIAKVLELADAEKQEYVKQDLVLFAHEQVLNGNTSVDSIVSHFFG